jgi:1-deoxy-D-xylulose-5-phosphate reductoisomerase
MKKRRLIVLGSTGSIGLSTLEVVRHLRKELEIVALAAGANCEVLYDQISEFRPNAVALRDELAAERLSRRLREAPSVAAPTVFAGGEGLVGMIRATPADIVVAAISGAAGLPAVLTALETGKDLALANKESLVMAGNVVTRRARELDRKILPVDSEHSAIFQCLHSGRSTEVRRLILTASGGPFRSSTREELSQVLPSQALRHPTWNMGAKITVDSATLMNKALEIIEAHWLFSMPPEQIGVVVHPQSVVHSLVEFVDGSTLCQLGFPDMKVPIQYALTFPERLPSRAATLDLPKIGQLTFEEPDLERFPSIRLAYEALRAGGSASTVLNGANEVAVGLFLEGKLPFLGVFDLLESVLGAHHVEPDPDLDAIFEADRWARERAFAWAGGVTR